MLLLNRCAKAARLTILSVMFDNLSQNYYICLNKLPTMRKLAIIFALIFSLGASAQSVDADRLTRLPDHPRLILREGDVERLRASVEQVPQMERLYAYLLDRADKALEAPLSERKKQGKRLLTVSRNVLDRVLHCSLAYLMTGNAEYAVRAEQEMLAAAGFVDWNPSHFLDVGEMTAALALGYDWLYDWLSEESRQTIERAIIEKGLCGAESDRQTWFYRRENNWNQVCNGGLTLGALAVAERAPEVAAQIVEKALATISLGLRPYAPDGVYPEGYSYWSYGTWYQVVLIEALRTALGSSYDLENAAGFLQSADFMRYMVAPSAKSFNFSDCGAGTVHLNLLLAWFAAERGDMSLVYREFESLRSGKIRVLEGRLFPIAMLFLSRCDLSSVTPPKGDFWYGKGEQPLFVYRSGWSSTSDAYLAAKGGSASLSHAHMDAGSFVYEWGGVRWSCDLGSQNYYSLESRGVKLWSMGQDAQRWDVFRLNNISHSTLSVEGERHLCAGSAEMTEVYNTPECHGAKFDMSSVLKGLRRAERTLTIDGLHSVTVVDALESEQACRVRWVMCTPAEPKVVDNRTILLSSAGRRLMVEVLSPHRVKAFVLSNDPPHDYDAPNKGTCRIGFTLDLRAGKPTELKVRLVPVM